jgi:LmbE family N-acetylglucosaminyl deacetylase
MYPKSRFLKRIRAILLLLCAAAILPYGALAAPEEGEAVCMNDVCTIRVNGGAAPRGLLDGSTETYAFLSAGSTITVAAPDEIAGVYIKFDNVPGSWSISTAAGTIACGENDLLHEYAAVGASESTLSFSEAVAVADIYLFPEGELPDWVQRWDPPWDRADLLLLPTHSDDELLFFAGLIPMALDAGARVQVAYFVHHWDERLRPHESLDGLWTCGLRNYPVFGQLHDSYTETREEAASILASEGWSYEEIVGLQAELLRRHRPQIVVTHDINGEYGQGAHMLSCAAMLDAVGSADDPQAYPDSAARYGVWDVPKTYVHLYEENPVVLNLDEPLDSFGGKTAFRLAQDAFWCHETQLYWGGFRYWLFRQTLASEIVTYSPCEYGLWRSLVGPDTRGDTMFEHIVFYDEQVRLAEEAEQAQIAARDAAREEALAKEKAPRLAEEEAEQAEEAESSGLTEGAPEEEAQELFSRGILPAILCASAAVCIFTRILLISMRKRAPK